MSGFFQKIFGRKDDDTSQKEEPQLNEVDRQIADIRNTVMDLQSKGKAIGAERDRLRGEIRQKDQENQRLMDEYESLADGLEKDMVMGTLAANEDVLDEFRKRVDGLNKAWGDNEKLRQIMKRTLERLIAAKSAGKSMEEIAKIIDETAREGDAADIGLGFVMDAGDKLGGTAMTASADANREKVLAKLAARRGVKAQVAPQRSESQSNSPTAQQQSMQANQL